MLRLPCSAKDNCPPGGDIAHPTIHKEAGGVGTYADPITFAGASKALPPGTIIYVHSAHVQRYAIMEDDCEVGSRVCCRVPRVPRACFRMHQRMEHSA